MKSERKFQKVSRGERVGEFFSRKRLRRIANKIISLAHETDGPESLTLFGRVYEDTGKILTTSDVIETYLVDNQLPEDITIAEIDAIKALFVTEDVAILANSLAFDEPDQLAPIYGLLRNTYSAPIEGMDAYRYVAIRHAQPNPYGLDCEFFVVGLHKDENPERHGEVTFDVLGKASLEPVFLDVVDSLPGERFATPADLAKVVHDDRRTLSRTLLELEEAFSADQL